MGRRLLTVVLEFFNNGWNPGIQRISDLGKCYDLWVVEDVRYISKCGSAADIYKADVLIFPVIILDVINTKTCHRYPVLGSV